AAHTTATPSVVHATAAHAFSAFQKSDFRTRGTPHTRFSNKKRTNDRRSRNKHKKAACTPFEYRRLFHFNRSTKNYLAASSFKIVSTAVLIAWTLLSST